MGFAFGSTCFPFEGLAFGSIAPVLVLVLCVLLLVVCGECACATRRLLVKSFRGRLTVMSVSAGRCYFKVL